MSKLCFSTLGLPGTTLAQAMATGAKYGFTGVEVRGQTAGHLGNDDPPAARAAAVADAKANGLTIAALMGYTNFSTLDDTAREKSVQSCLKAIQLAKDINAPVLRIFGGEPEDHNTSGAIPRAAEAIKRVAPAAQAAGVSLAIESHDAWCLADNVLGLINAVNHPALKVCWDPANTIGHADIAQTFGLLKNHIVHVHLKDITLGENNKHVPAIPGEGIVPLPEIVGMLKSIHYPGWLSLEWEKWWVPALPDASVAFPAYINLMRKIGA